MVGGVPAGVVHNGRYWHSNIAHASHGLTRPEMMLSSTFVLVFATAFGHRRRLAGPVRLEQRGAAPPSPRLVVLRGTERRSPVVLRKGALNIRILVAMLKTWGAAGPSTTGGRS